MGNNPPACQITYIGAATIILEIAGLRLLTDPVFDPAGGAYAFGWGTHSRKLADPAIAVDQLGAIDAVLLSHDHHEDNLDRLGRQLLPTAGRVLTTRTGAQRLGGNAHGLAPWSSVELESPTGLRVRITATPARHGPPGSRPLVGEVIGFMLEWPGQRYGALYISGDTVWFRGIPAIARRFRVGTVIVHLGGVRFPLYGPLRFTMNSHDAIRSFRTLQAHQCIPIHYEDWQHFRETRPVAEAAFRKAGIDHQMIWLPKGQPTQVEI